MKNSKVTLLTLSAVLVLSFAGRVSAAPDRDWSQWLSHYYQNPEADQVVPAVFALSQSGYFDGPGQPATSIGFLSAVFSQNPDKVDGWMAAFRHLPVAHQRLVASALWYSGLPHSDRPLRALARNSASMQGDIDQLLAKGVTPVRDTAVLSESSLNLQWGAFLASGDQQHIVNALAALGSDTPGLSAKARYSLAQKAAAHQRVYEICQAELARQPANVRDQLRTALADVRVQP
jgi:hypothetical protein